VKRKAIICLELPSENLLKVLLKALLPETKKPTTSRSKVSIEGKGKKLTIQIKAKDTSALRATLNSYLRWAVLVKDIYNVAASLEETSQV